MSNDILKKREVVVDKSICTVVSGIPFRLNELKPGLFPVGLFTLPPVKKIGDIHSIVVREGHYFRYVGDGKSIEQYEKAEVIARSIVEDYVNAQVGVARTDEDVEKHANPAIFWIHGEFTSDDIKSVYQAKIDLALQQQRNWFSNLIKIADDDWNKYRQHKMISDLQRYAAETLNHRREWSNIQGVGVQPDVCPACKSMIPGGALICQICRTIINKAEFDKLGLKQAV